MSPVTDLMQLALQLRAISRDDGSIDAAQVRLIGLDEIRMAAGDNWPRMRERVREGSFHILSRFVGPEDVIVPAGDGFLVILGRGASPGNNQERCRRMREALLSFYLGDEALKALKPEVSARTLSVDGFADLVATSLATKPDVSAQEALLRDDITEARMFSMREGRVVGRWICPVRHEQIGRRLAYDVEYILDGLHRGVDFIGLDLAILDYAHRRAEEQDQAQLAIAFTVHASTLQVRKHRDLYFAALAAAPTAFKRRAIITIAEIERGAPLILITERCSTLRTMIRRVCLELHYTDHAISSIGSTGAWAAGFHLPIHSGAQKGTRSARTLDQIRFWSRALKSQGMRFAVNGFREPDFVEAARDAGAEIATSDVLWPFAAKSILQTRDAAA